MFISHQTLQELFQQQYGYINNFDIHNFLPYLVEGEILSYETHSDGYFLQMETN